MEQSTAALAVALRVLTAVNQKRHPDESDVTELRRLAPLFANEPLDVLACEVIQQALKRRSETDRARGGSA
jgi:hypothetical protein